jgi:hypothetical protein
MSESVFPKLQDEKMQVRTHSDLQGCMSGSEFGYLVILMFSVDSFIENELMSSLIKAVFLMLTEYNIDYYKT